MSCGPDRAWREAVTALLTRLDTIEKRLEALEAGKPEKPPKDKETK